jgi:NADH-quinone oxidoreductase subunit G
MAIVHVNGKPVDIGSAKLNLIQAAERAGVQVPYYCWHPAMTVVASCRMCLVEVGEKKPDGSIGMQPKVVPACQTPARDGTVVVTNSDKARYAQKQTLESLLLNHPLDCPVCDKAGECTLQDFSYRFGRSQTRLVDEKNTPPNKPDISPTIALFTDRCIMCSRCVRFTREIAGTAELQVINRGNHSEIDIFPGEPLNNKLAGNVVDLCPVGALCSKDFLYKQRVWFLKSHRGVCADCSTGCSVFVDHNKNVVYRLRPRTNAKAQGYFMCDEGRYGFHYVNSQRRFLQPFMRQDGQANAAAEPAPYANFLAALRQRLADVAAGGSGRLACVISPFMTCEEAFLLAKFIKGLSKEAILALGHVPVHGQDDTYPKDRSGRPVEPVKFTIRAEKCPNRKGIEAVLRHFQGEVVAFEAILEQSREGKLQGMYIAASYPPRQQGWISDEQAASLKNISFLVVQDMFPSAASQLAHMIVPGTSFAEKDGTFVNQSGLGQSFTWAIRPPKEVRTDGQVFLDLLERRGLWHGATVRSEMAREIEAFASLVASDADKDGVLLNL